VIAVFRDRHGDLFLHHHHTWTVVNAETGEMFTADESVIPDHLDVLAPLMAMGRRRTPKPVPAAERLAAAAVVATGPLWTGGEEAPDA